jgi:hypothetical protein
MIKLPGLALLASIVAMLLIPATGTASAASPQEALKCPRGTKHGKTTKDWEAVFGRRRLKANAVILLRKVRARGFRRTVIEREQCIFEVAIIGLHTQKAAIAICDRARLRGLSCRTMQS